MDRKIYIIFVAGGSGVRMGGNVPKQFRLLDGVPVLQRTMERLLEAWPASGIVTVLPAAHFDTWKSLCVRHAFNLPQKLVEGGMSRFHSVRNALEKVPDGVIVAVHDGMRPFPSKALLDRLLRAMSEGRAAVPALAVSDSLKFRDGSLPEPDRSAIVAVQTPQLFLSEELKEAYRMPYDPALTDDMSVAVRAGIPVKLVEGDRYNVKLTCPEDLEVARLLLGR